MEIMDESGEDYDDTNYQGAFDKIAGLVAQQSPPNDQYSVNDRESPSFQ